GDFPTPPPAAPTHSPSATRALRALDPVERARRYLAKVGPAIAGQHGDIRTFRVCCRLMRGFALTEDAALSALQDWNSQCEPPWTEGELRRKLASAVRYGQEPFGEL